MVEISGDVVEVDISGDVVVVVRSGDAVVPYSKMIHFMLTFNPMKKNSISTL